MFERIIMNRTPGNTWEIIADGVDITEFVMGWKIEPIDDKPYGPPKIWFAFLPEHIIMDSKWRSDEDDGGCLG